MNLYAVTITLSAFLLFQVQPLITKIILPWFGGSAAVWSAALLFFQLVLLAGYTYAHALTRMLKPRGQVAGHVALLALSCALLPILPSPSWKSQDLGDPTFHIIAALIATVGLPYFLLATTSPLLQVWYVRHRDAEMPYRLFALSNLGSMLALLTFPFLVEPHLTSRQQAFTWSGAYVVFAALCALVAWSSQANAAGVAASTAATTVRGAKGPPLSEMLLWIGLAACASTLLMSVTNHMSQDIATIPLLWVLPLALYLLTFILAFARDRLYQRWIYVPLLVLAMIAMAHFMWAGYAIKRPLVAFAAGLFVCCAVCHGELSRRRPPPRHLTTFYLLVALGGAVGGVFVALLAPHVFRTYLELPIGLVACAALTVIVLWKIDLPSIGAWPLRVTLIIGTTALAAYLAHQERLNRAGYRLIARNFYGVLRVGDDARNVADRDRTLFNGMVDHGSQLLDIQRRYEPTEYYGPNSGVGRAIRALEETGPIRVGSIGLGAGVLSTYGRPGDVYRIYEINPLVLEIAQSEFSFYRHSPADKRILLGDARLTLERQESQQFDLLSVDAFTGDAIPIHLLTNEALALYFRHLKPHGILAIHISNRYVNLAPVCGWGAQTLGKTAIVVEDDGSGRRYLTSSTWVLMTDKPEWFDTPSFRDASTSPAVVPRGFRGWTDDYSNVLELMRLR